MARKETESPELDENVALATRTETGIQLGESTGEVPETIYLPFFEMAFGVGNLAENYAPGDFVLNKDTLLAHKGESVELIILNKHSYWKEYTTSEMWDAGLTPRRFDTREEVLEAGGTVPLPNGKWPDNQPPSFNGALRMNILVRKPESLISGLFGVTIGDHEYAPAQWDIDKTTYTAVAPKVSGAVNLALRERGIQSGVFTISSTVAKNRRGNVIPRANIRLSAHLTDAELEELQALFA